MSKNGYKDLVVWNKSMDMVVATYDMVADFPSSEIYGLSSQIKRSAVSIPSNIAEGSKRFTNKDFCQFLSIAYGSGAELETQIEIVKRVGLGKNEKIMKVENLLSEIMKMLNKAIVSIRKK